MHDEQPVILDGGHGEGGGQILRTALSLSLHTGRAFRLTAIRQNREKPGLRPQHMLAVLSAQRLGSAYVEGATVGSRELWFEPKQKVTPGTYFFDIGTAGSTLLVMQTLLPALLAAEGPSTLTLCGGTHNLHAPPFEFIERVYLPRLAQIGHRVSISLLRPGFYPIGGGKLTVQVNPTTGTQPLEILSRGQVRSVRAEILVSRLPMHISQREQSTLMSRLHIPLADCQARTLTDCEGPGNALLTQIETESGSELFCAIGERGVRAEQVASDCADEVDRFLLADVPVGEYLADQLLLPLALGSGGRFLTSAPSLHTLTQVDTLRAFLPVEISIEQKNERAHLITVSPR